MTLKVRHILEGEAVVIRATRDGHLVSSFAVKDDEAKRLGWSLVSDLDPDEADAIQNEQGERRRQMIRSRMMRLMSLTPCTLTEMSSVLGISGSDLSGFILPMTKARLVVRSNPREGRTPAIWALTESGMHEVAKEGLAHIARTSTHPKLTPVAPLFELPSLSPKKRRRRRRRA